MLPHLARRVQKGFWRIEELFSSLSSKFAKTLKGPNLKTVPVASIPIADREYLVVSESFSEILPFVPANYPFKLKGQLSIAHVWLLDQFDDGSANETVVPM